jgi:formate/nitrite transporter FocA (FNT family)
MENIINLLMNNGIGVVCVAYLIYFQNTTMKEILKTLKLIDKRLTRIETKTGIKEVDDDGE